MKFCTFCGSRLIPDTRRTILQFRCEKCKELTGSTNEDSLRIEIDYEAAESSEKYEVFEENSVHDTAGKKIAVECPKCKMPYLTHVYIGTASVSKYVCECGFNILSKDMKKEPATAQPATQTQPPAQ
jgi:DNA-directed RNA polymerase subunit M/transcription elongation factor TFIIS